MKQAADAIKLPASHLRTARINAESRRTSELNRMAAERPGWIARGTPEADEREAKLREIHLRIHSEMVAEHEERYTQAKEELEKQRATFVRRGRIELK